MQAPAESLRWTMEGKTAWEGGHVLGISERTAALHVNNATHKLGCVNKHQAVLKALRLPTVARECEKVAGRCAKENADPLGFLLQLCEPEPLGRGRRPGG